jgi:hypothetical protein
MRIAASPWLMRWRPTGAIRNWRGNPTYRRAPEGWVILATTRRGSKSWTLSMIISTVHGGMSGAIDYAGSR